MASMSIRPQTKPHQPVMLRFEEGVAPERGGPPLGPWQAWLPPPQAIEGTFPKPIIAQGLAAYQRGKVRSLNLRRVDLVATVADTETHTTTLTRDTSRPPLGLRCNCTCRYGYDCKHAVAALYMLIELASQSPDPPPDVPGGDGSGNGHVNAADATRPLTAATNGHTATIDRSRPPLPPSTNGHAGPAPAIRDLLDMLAPHHEAVVPRRRLWVVIGFDDRLGVFYAQLRLDAPKLHGV